jgi:hypothetical protein
MANILLRRVDCLGIKAIKASLFECRVLVSFIFFYGHLLASFTTNRLFTTFLGERNSKESQNLQEILIAFRDEKFLRCDTCCGSTKKGTKPQKVLSFHNCVDDYFSIIAFFGRLENVN